MEFSVINIYNDVNFIFIKTRVLKDFLRSSR